ncbi:MAG: gamma-glutamylcyclotransferase [Labilithrix sp.]|nr:gamma-glutamylcyclotransferase [Labilithrix sp.]
MEAERVFVYGTLMRGHANHRVLVALGARFVGEAVTIERFRLIDLGPYPALVRGDGVHAHGELFAIAPEKLPELDAFEGCPDLYVRERVLVDAAGERVFAFTYFFAREAPADAVVITSGRYDEAAAHEVGSDPRR